MKHAVVPKLQKKISLQDIAFQEQMVSPTGHCDQQGCC